MKKSEIKKLLALREEQLERAVKALRRAEARLVLHNMFLCPLGHYPMVMRDETGQVRVAIGDMSKIC